MQPAENPIDSVIRELEALVSWSLAENSRLGYFASLNLRVTKTIRSKIGTGYFDDDERTARLDVTFASRYLSAVKQFRANDPALSHVWSVAFNASSRDDLIVVQHLLLAMNPHISIDLPIAAAQTSPGASISTLKDDFTKINAVLAGIVPTVIRELDALSPLLHLVADLAEDGEVTIIDFGLAAARNESWTDAQSLAVLSAEQQDAWIAAKTQSVVAISNAIASPDFVAAEVVALVRAVEVKDVPQIIRALNTGELILDSVIATAVAAPPSGSIRTVVSDESRPGSTKPIAPNQVYYFEVGPGSWSGTFTFEITSWRGLWSSSMTVKDKLLASAMQVFQSAFGGASIANELTPHPDGDSTGTAFNRIRIHKSWFTLWRSDETYTLSPNGHRVRVDAHVNFGPLAFLFREHDVYPATVVEDGTRNIYKTKLLGTRLLGQYDVQPDRRQVRSSLTNGSAVAHEVLNKVADAQ
jgi:uncharacterized protein DUF5995